MSEDGFEYIGDIIKLGNHVDQPVAFINEKMIIVWANLSFQKIFGRGAIGKTCYSGVKNLKARCKDCPWKNNLENSVKFNLQATDKKKLLHEFICNMEKKEYFSNGQLLHGYIVIFKDLTNKTQKRKRILNSLKEKNNLLREIHHRVKNNLQIISNLLTLQTYYHPDENFNLIVNKTISRLKIMGSLYKKVYEGNEFNQINLYQYIQYILSTTITDFKSEKQKVDFIVKIDPAIHINLDQATVMGLIIQESILNSLQHAFIGQEFGRIQIEYKNEINHEEYLLIRDNGCGISKETLGLDDPGFGLELINLLALQLKAKMEITNCDGTCIRLDFDKNKENRSKWNQSMY